MRQVVWVLGGLVIAAVVAMVVVFVMFEDMIRDQVETTLSPMIDGGVRLGELQFDSATGWTRIEEVSVGTAERGFTAGPVTLTIDLESMTRRQQILIEEMTIEQMSLLGGSTFDEALKGVTQGIVRPAAIGHQSDTRSTLPPVALKKFRIAKVNWAKDPDGLVVEVSGENTSKVEEWLPPEAFLDRFFSNLQQRVMDATAKVRAQ